MYNVTRKQNFERGINKTFYQKTHLDVASTTIYVLFVFNLKLNDESFPFIWKGLLELGRNTVKFSVLACLNTCSQSKYSCYTVCMVRKIAVSAGIYKNN